MQYENENKRLDTALWIISEIFVRGCSTCSSYNLGKKKKFMIQVQNKDLEGHTFSIALTKMRKILSPCPVGQVTLKCCIAVDTLVHTCT